MLKLKNKILLLIFSLQIFANFNSEVLCSRTDASGLHVATALAKYVAFTTSNAYGLKGDESKELTVENIYLALDAFDSLIKIDHFLSHKGPNGPAELAVLCEGGSIIYDLVTFVKNVIKLKENGSKKIKKNDNKKAKSKNQKLSPSMKKKIFYTFLKHSAILSEVACSIDFAGDSSKRLKVADIMLGNLLRFCSRFIDYKSAEIPNRIGASLSFLGAAFMGFVAFNIKKADTRKHVPEKISLAGLKERYGERISNNCSICQDNLDKNVLVTSACHHVFCQECLNGWLRSGGYCDDEIYGIYGGFKIEANTCPYCNTKIDRVPISFELESEAE